MKNAKYLSELISTIPSFPVMGIRLNPSNAIRLDLSATNKHLATVDLLNTAEFSKYVMSQIEEANAEFGFGGFFEKRAIYSRSEVFANGSEKFRNLHLGIDIWGKDGSPVFAPLDGRIHSLQNNVGFGNYGPTIILEHNLGDGSFFTLYGHLALADLNGLTKGQPISAGERFCSLGPFPENGDWPPHLHFQVISDLGDNWGDYPGVCASEDEGVYREICIDPSALLLEV